jgi:hypothetical protein
MLPLGTYGNTDASTRRRPADAVDSHGERIDHRGVVDAHAPGAGRVQGGLGVAGNPVEDLLVGLDRRAGEISPPLNGSNAGAPRMRG